MKQTRWWRWCGMLLLLLCAGCGGCGQTVPLPETGNPAADTATDDLAGLSGDTAAGGGLAYITGVAGEAWSGSAGAEVKLAPGTKLIAAATLRTGNGTLDLFFPDRGVARLLAGTTAQLTWEAGTPRLSVSEGTAGLIAGGLPAAGLTARTGKFLLTLRLGVAAVRAAATGGEVAVASGDARVQAEERLLFVNAGEMLLPGVNGEPPAVMTQDPSWPARFAALRGIMHTDEFTGLARPAPPAAPAETTALAARFAPERGYLMVRRLSSQGVALTGSCRVYDAQRDRDIFGTTLDFPGDMPVRLPAGTYVVELVYTDINYPPETGVEIIANATREVVFKGFGRLELRRAVNATLPMFFRVYDLASGREVTRASLELPPGGGAVELLPGSYRIELVYADRTQPGFDRVVVTERQTTTVEVRQ